MNLPNAITASRIAVSPLIALLPFAPSATLRFGGFALFIVAAVTDYYDGALARSRNLVTDLGRLLDPLADKLLLLSTLVPMYLLMAPAGSPLLPSRSTLASAGAFPFDTPLGTVPLPLWVLLVVLGRELFMTVFRQFAAGRGVIISAIGPAKWKTGFQWTWVGSAFFWFGASTLAQGQGWSGGAWQAFAWFNGIVGVTSMVGAVALTLYSLYLYMREFGGIFTGQQRDTGH